MCRRNDLWTRLIKNAVEDPTTMCLVWQGGTSGDEETTRGHGYGRVSIDGQTSTVHRVSFMIHFGYLGSKSHVDHLCENRLCFNPYHLERTTPKQNMARRDGKAKKSAPAISWRWFGIDSLLFART